MSVALNAAAYYAPPCGQNGYFKNYFKVVRFWMIPFCVSSISVACNSSPNDCKLLFPTNDLLLIIFLCGIIGIMTIGLIINKCILPRLRGFVYNEDEEDDEECGGGDNERGIEIEIDDKVNMDNGSYKNGKRVRSVKNGKEINRKDEDTETIYDAIPLTQVYVDNEQ